MYSPLTLATPSLVESAVVDSLDEAIEFLVVGPQLRSGTDHLVEPLRNRDPLFGGEFIDRALPPEVPARRGGFVGLAIHGLDLGNLRRWVLRLLDLRDLSWH